MKLTIFYSWQSETESQYNHSLIGGCIQKAMNNIENSGQLKGVFFNPLQESTKGEAGSPDIVQSIENGLNSCDIFIGDLTITNKYPWVFEQLEKNPDLPYRFNPNSNVYGEYNWAFGRLGYKKIIAVMNSFYGNPKENPEILPFDIRQKRFPFLYECHNEGQIESSKSSLTIDFENALRETVLEIIDENQFKYRPFLRFQEQKKEIQFKVPFFSNEIIDDNITKISENKSNIRINGLSGMGKTRLVFEAINTSEDYKNAYLYCDCFDVDDFQDVINVLESVFRNKESVYLVIDNCDDVKASRIMKLKRRYQSNAPLITIHNQFDEEELDNCSYILLNRGVDDIIQKIIDKKGTGLTNENKQLILEFSGGFPLMAILLLENVNKENLSLEKVASKKFLNKIITGDDVEREILKSCSLFRYVGVESEAKSQIEFVLTNKDITPISGSDEEKLYLFNKVLNKYSKREIFEKNGRLVGIRPRPLAFSLAAEWFELCDSERLNRVFESLQHPDNSDGSILIESLAKQIIYIGDNPKVAALVKKITDVNGPFDNAKVLNTELGSRLFRSFVEVNPVAVAENLYRLFGSKSIEELVKVETGRRNLVWTLEKLCFDNTTFEKGAKLMMSFAVAENETWGNNATAEFIRLFKILLPGTQASLLERQRIIQWGLSKDDDYKELAFKAINSAFQTQGFSYFSGAEKQGTKKLEHYQPDTNEIREYWANLLSILKQEILSGTKYLEHSCKILSQNIRGFARSGAIDLMLPIINEVVVFKNNDWDEMLDSLYSILNYDSDYFNEDTKEVILRNIDALTKDDFVSRFLEVKKHRKRGKTNISFQDNIKQQQEVYSNLATEFVEKEYYSKDILMALYRENDSFSNPFGSTISQLTNKDFDKSALFIDCSLDAFSELSQFNPSIFIDFSKNISEDVLEHLINSIRANPNLSYLLFPILGVRRTEFDNLEILFSMIEKDLSLVKNFRTFFNYHIITPENDDKITELLKRICSYSQEGLNTAISIASSILFFNQNVSQFIVLTDFIKETIKKISFENNKQSITDDFFQLITHFLEKLTVVDLAVYINNQVISISNDSSISFAFNYNFERLYSVLLEKYFDDIWEDLSKALLSEGDNYWSFYNFKGLLGAHIGSGSNTAHILFKQENYEKLLKWCEENSERAPVRLASMIPIYQDKGFHTLVISLLDKYGNNQNMLDSLSANMGSFSWSGSTIPLYEQKINALQSLIPHDNKIVEDWANQKIEWTKKDIEREQQREDEEKFLYS